jgi:hypothetical protein
LPCCTLFETLVGDCVTQLRRKVNGTVVECQNNVLSRSKVVVWSDYQCQTISSTTRREIMADDRMRNREHQKNAGTKTDQGNLGHNAPSRNPNDDQLAGQRGGQGKDQGLSKGPNQGNTSRDEAGFEKGGYDRGQNR